MCRACLVKSTGMIDPESVRSVPTRPGCYIFKSAEGELLYVGKAASLRARLRSYFSSPSQQSIKIRVMLSQAARLETIVTDSEIEALILENNLIKEHRPRYNVRMRDDKQYPYICITLEEPFPRLLKVRHARKDKNLYFGPYADGQGLNETLITLKKLFPYRSCDISIPDEADSPDPVLARPCLEFFIKRCTAPCVRYTTREEYRAVIDQVVLLLQGKHEEVLKQLRGQMKVAAGGLDFEQAARIRDQVEAIEKLLSRQKMTSSTKSDQDVIAVARDEAESAIEMFHVRAGKVVARDTYLLEAEHADPAETLAAFIEQYYERAAHVPKEILLPVMVENGPLLEEWLSGLRGSRVALEAPERGQKRKLVSMVGDNAHEALEQHRLRWMSDQQRTTAALVELREALGLTDNPNRIECYDISNIQGTSAVGSMVVFDRGKAKNSEYRRFKIKTVEGANDFAMMSEMLKRRFRRIETDGGDESFGKVPDLVIIDGGKGQLNAAHEALEEVGRGNLVIVSLAKRLEEIFVPGRTESILLPRTSQGLYLVQRIRDEAHRFALSYHRNVRQKHAVKSQIDALPGVGQARRKALIKAFGSVRGVKAASTEEIAAVPGISAKLAESIKSHLGSSSIQ